MDIDRTCTTFPTTSRHPCQTCDAAPGPERLAVCPTGRVARRCEPKISGSQTQKPTERPFLKQRPRAVTSALSIGEVGSPSA